MPHAMAYFGAIVLLFATANALEPRVSSNQPASAVLTKQIKPHFPIRLLKQGVTHGEATIAVTVDPSGKVSDYLVTRYTHKEFADASLSALREWEFAPTAGVSLLLEATFIFRTDGMVVIERHGMDRDLPELVDSGRYAFSAAKAAELDRTPKPVRVVSPLYPAELKQQGVSGTVEVSFYIDQGGRVRFVAPSAADNPLLAACATAAVEQWQFEPPTRRGKPALVRATQRFAFVATD